VRPAKKQSDGLALQATMGPAVLEIYIIQPATLAH